MIITIGNHWRRDDGVGPAVACWLMERLPENLQIIQHDGEGTYLMDAWRGLDTVVLVDAVRSGAAPGTIHRFDASSTALPPGIFHYSSHLFGVAEAVELARVLNRLPERLVIYGIEGAAFEYGEGLTPAVARAVPEVARRILEEFDE